MRRIAIAAAKGGTAKTTTAVSLAHGLALAGRRVVLVDCDPRRQASLSFGLPEGAGVAGLMSGESAEVVQVREGLQVIDSGGAALLEVEMRLAGTPGAAERLQRALQLLPDADFVLFDCPPHLGLVHLNVLVACDEILLPVAADFLSLAGARQLLACLQSLPGDSGKRPRLLGLLPTFCDSNAGTWSDFEAALHSDFAGRVLQSRVHHSESLRAAPAQRSTIFESDPLSRAALDYALLTEEILDLG